MEKGLNFSYTEYLVLNTPLLPLWTPKNNFSGPRTQSRARASARGSRASRGINYSAESSWRNLKLHENRARRPSRHAANPSKDPKRPCGTLTTSGPPLPAITARPPCRLGCYARHVVHDHAHPVTPMPAPTHTPARYRGRPCPRGHDGTRYRRNGACVHCIAESAARRDALEPGLSATRKAASAARHHDARMARQRARRHADPDGYRARNRADHAMRKARTRAAPTAPMLPADCLALIG